MCPFCSQGETIHLKCVQYPLHFTNSGLKDIGRVVRAYLECNTTCFQYGILEQKFRTSIKGEFDFVGIPFSVTPYEHILEKSIEKFKSLIEYTHKINDFIMV